ncbi:MAG: hypothetical protein J4472_00145 [DPANN group archaeon]|nr:hypothetical protein [DPANN group archaeon]
MQDGFVLKAKGALRKIAAVSSTAAMMGATMFGAAAAADLAEYPSPFIKNGQWVGLIVVGADAAPSDIIGATDIAVTLAQSATTSAGGGSIVTVGGKTQEINLGNFVGNVTPNGFDAELQDDAVSGLKDSSITFQSTSYDYHDEVVFQNGTTAGKGPRVVTSLVAAEDDYKSGVFLEVDRGTFGYYYIFDSTINISKTTTSDPLTINFLGRKVKITSVTDDDTFTARVGEEVFMNVGDTATVSGKKITLKNVGSATTNTPVIIDVDGVQETVTGTETVNGLEVNVAETFYSENLAERAATLVVGSEAVETYNDGDKFIEPCATAWKTANCKKEDPDWVWDIDGLILNAAGDIDDVNGANGGQTLGVINDYVINDDSDGPITVGGKYDLPLGGFELRFDSLSLADNKYAEITVKYEASADLSDATGFTAQTAEPAILIESSVSDSLLVTAGGANKKTNRIYITVDDIDNNRTNIFYRNPSDGKITVAGNVTIAQITNGTGNASQKFGELSYDDTKSTNVVLSILGDRGGTELANVLNVTFDVIDDNSYLLDKYDDISIWFGNSATGDITGLGGTASLEEAHEVAWGKSVPGNLTLGTKDEDHRTRYGIVIKDPKGNGASDRAKFLVPADAVTAQISVAGPEATTTTTGGAVAISSVAGVPIAKLDTEVTDKKAYDVIVVGGPAVNRLAAEALGLSYPSYGAASGIPQDAGLIKLVENAYGGTKTAVVVAGWESQNTRDASAVLKDYKAYGLSGSAVKVSSSAGVITVGPLAVAASVASAEEEVAEEPAA